jgi:hypothetical protein
MLDLGHYGPAARFFETLSAQAGAGAAEGPSPVSPCEDQAFALAGGAAGGVLLCSGDVAAYLSGVGAGAEAGGGAGGSTGAGGGVGGGWQHVYPGSVGGSSHFVLYGLIGSPSFCNMHQVNIHICVF